MMLDNESKITHARAAAARAAQLSGATDPWQVKLRNANRELAERYLEKTGERTHLPGCEDLSVFLAAACGDLSGYEAFIIPGREFTVLRGIPHVSACRRFIT